MNFFHSMGTMFSEPFLLYQFPGKIVNRTTINKYSYQFVIIKIGLSRISHFVIFAMGPRNILVCGTGSASHVLIAKLGALPGWNISLFSISSRGAKFAHSIQSNGLSCKDDCEPSFPSNPVKVTADDVRVFESKAAKAAAENADMIILALPAYAHETYLQTLLPYFKNNGILLLMPSYSFGDLLVRLLFNQSHLNTENAMLHVITAEQLPWICRTSKFGESVRILSHKKEVSFSAISLCQGEFKPGVKEYVDVFLDLLSVAFRGKAEVSTSVLSSFAMSLRIPNALMHAAVLCGFYECEDSCGFMKKCFEKPPMFYNGVSADTARLLDDASNEVIQVRDAVLNLNGNWEKDLMSIKSFYEWIRCAYPKTTFDNSTTESCLRTNEATKSLVHPMVQGDDGLFRPDHNHRYIQEDVPFGLLSVKSLACVVEVNTPTIDKIIGWAQRVSGQNWLDCNGCLTSESKKAPLRTLKRFQIEHFEDIKKLFID